MSIKTFRVALLGFGTVGTGVFEFLHESSSEIQAKNGIRFEVTKVLVRHPEAARPIDIPKEMLAYSVDEIIQDDSIDVVVEVMGGVEPAKDYLLKAMKAGKHAITANKELMGRDGDRLVKRARETSQFFGYAGAVTGFHQLCPSIAASIAIQSLAGVFNGTANYILSRMTAGLSMEAALVEAQEKGYAEADPSADIDGGDTRNKLVMAASLAFRDWWGGSRLQEIPISGIRNITQVDIQHAREMGYAIRLLGLGGLVGTDSAYAKVAPCLVPENDPLAAVHDVNNGIRVFDTFRGMQGMVAQGAGSRPTAMAVFSDLIKMANKELILWPEKMRKLKFARSRRERVPYYIRIAVTNAPGALASVAQDFAKVGINIQSVIQKGDQSADVVPVVVVTGETDDKSIQTLQRRLVGKNENVDGDPLVMSIERNSLEQPAKKVA